MDHANHAGHAGHTMTTTTLAAAAAATTTAMSSMGSHGHHHGHGGGGGCKISMLWNWDAVGTCFISSTWHVTSSAVFAGSCIGVVLLVMVLELLRRSVKEYDRSLLRRHAARQLEAGAAPAASPGTKPGCDLGAAPTTTASAYRPAILEQAVRALLHMAQFAVAYFVMLWVLCTTPCDTRDPRIV